MTPLGAAIYYPLWAVTVGVGFTALRLSRRSAPGLIALCIMQATWVVGLALLESDAVEFAERVLPSGMLLAGAFAQSAQEVAGRPRGKRVLLAWLLSAVVALVGLIAPRLLYGPGARGAGPLFVPLALLSVLGTLVLNWQLLSLARAAASGLERRRRTALFMANLFGALGGGGAITLHVLGLAPAAVAAPFLLVSVLLAAFAVWSGERGRDREIISQGFVHALVTAVLSSFALLGFYALLPALVPGGELLTAWGLFVVFFAALALDPLRQWLLDSVLGRIFKRPIGVRALAGEVALLAGEREHAERLAEIGRLASAVAHEVRNPLGVVLAEAKLLERAGADAESIATLRDQVSRASRFVDDLLRWAKPRPLTLVDVDAADVARRAIAHASRALGREASSVELELASDALVIEADATALEDMLVNLLSNALIAVENKGGQVKLTLSREDAALVITVEDDGPGVPIELLPRLFEVFATGRGRDARHPGTGLGLATSARLAARHGGSLRHERPAVGGARFIARIPGHAQLDV